MPTFSRLHMQLIDATTQLRIAGEATDRAYREQIQLSAFDWDMSRDKPEGQGVTRGRAQPGEFIFHKVMDRASTSMLTKMRHGVRLNAVVTLDSPDDSGFKLTLTMANAVIVDCRIDIKDGEKSGEIEETWKLDYEVIEVAYMPTAKETLTSEAERKPGAESSKATLDAVLDAFKALNEAKRIDVSRKLKAEYKHLFPG